MLNLSALMVPSAASARGYYKGVPALEGWQFGECSSLGVDSVGGVGGVLPSQPFDVEESPQDGLVSPEADGHRVVAVDLYFLVGGTMDKGCEGVKTVAEVVPWALVTGAGNPFVRESHCVESPWFMVVIFYGQRWSFLRWAWGGVHGRRGRVLGLLFIDRFD